MMKTCRSEERKYHRMTDKEIREIIYNQTPIDRIMRIVWFKDFVEVTGPAGGDVLHYRIYNNGTIVER